jgi:peptidoglycan/LPS O-acetylase OafA/YrhL
VRRDIQALRGFSILAVLLYHAQYGWMRGGFLGVDTFFVISGFVITSKLMEGTGTFSKEIKEFYLRRAKRILPASLTVTLATAIFATFYLPAISRFRFSLDALASALFSANLNFARLGNDYLAQSADPSPYLHYWSLGVEEQFYILWPIAFLLIYKKRKQWLYPTLLITALGGIWFTSINPVASFYLPFSRFWEFFAGILLAMNPQMRAARKFRLPIAILGWLVLIFAVLWVKPSDATPGFTTVIAIVGAMAVLYARLDVRPQFLLPTLGDYSFSLYLVHWPIVVYFLDRNSILSWSNKIVIVVVGLTLSYLVTRFIERPARYQKKIQITLPKWGAIIALGAAASFSVLAFAASATGPVKLDKSVPITYTDGCHLNFGQSWSTHECSYGDTGSSTEVVLTGDSHAAQWFPALEKIATEKKWKLTSLTKSSCPATDLITLRNGKVDTSCRDWQSKVKNYISTHKPALVILTNFTEYQYPLQGGAGSYAQRWISAEEKFLASLHSPFLYLEDTPKPSSALHNFALSRSETTILMRQAAKSFGGSYVNPSAWLCSKNCSISYQGFNTYRDATHISVHTSLALKEKLALVIPL